jgi:HAD superfamily hydrolase (TIGR01549 family)
MLEEYELHSIRANKEEIRIFETIYFIKNIEKFGVPKNIKLAILSLNTRKAIKEALKLTTIEDRIDYIVGREDVRKWKPNPDGLLKIKEHFKVKKDEMIYFGDLDKDIMTGENAKIKSYLIDDLIKVVNEKKEKTKN